MESTSNPAPQIEIRTLHSIAEMRQLVHLQQEIWGYGSSDAELPYPARALFSLSESGGLVAEALVEGQTAGFSVAWLGREKPSGDWYLHSQLVGILPRFRTLGLGYRLKLLQRDFALQQGLKKVRWTFDPLQPVNANLNLRKLGAIVEKYCPDYYGSIRSRFSGGLESDRVWAEWYVASARVSRKLENGPPNPDYSRLPVVTRCRFQQEGEFGVLELLELNLKCSQEQILVEIPADFHRLSRYSYAIATAWRQGLREIFLHYLARSYRVDDFWSTWKEGRRTVFYHLSRRSVDEILAQ